MHPPRPGSGYRPEPHPGRLDCREYLRRWLAAYTPPVFSSAMIVADPALYHGRKVPTISVSLRIAWALGPGRSVTRPGESRTEECRSHGQERTYRGHAHQCSDGEVCSGNEMRAEAISDQEIEDDHIEQTCEQARRVGVASNAPIHVDGSCMGDESSQKDEWQDNPMTTKIVKEQVAGRNRSNGSCVKPKEHPHGIGRPEVVYDPLYKPAVQKGLVKDMWSDPLLPDHHRSQHCTS